MLCEYKWILFKYQLHKKTLLIVMISLFALLSLTIKWTRINSSTAWQQGKKHGGSSTEASCRLSAAYCQRNKLTKSFRPFFILNLRLQRDHRCIKRNNILSLYSTRLRRLTQILGEGLRTFCGRRYSQFSGRHIWKSITHTVLRAVSRDLCVVRFRLVTHAGAPTYTAVKRENFLKELCHTQC